MKDELIITPELKVILDSLIRYCYEKYPNSSVFNFVAKEGPGIFIFLEKEDKEMVQNYIDKKIMSKIQ